MTEESVGPADLFYLRREVDRNKTTINVTRGANKEKGNQVKKKMDERKLDEMTEDDVAHLKMLLRNLEHQD